jgi:hypothetical protein
MAMAGWTLGPYQVMNRQELRIGNEEREQAARMLTEHVSAGRLELSEFDERVHAAYAARTAGELAVLFADLPGQQPDGPRRRGDSRLGPLQYLPRRYLLTLLLLVAVGIAFAVVAFPPFFLIPVFWLVLRRRRRLGYAGYARGGYRRG